MKVSALEIVNLSKYVLQAVKFPLGYANAASPNILWGEIMEGQGINGLKVHCREIENIHVDQYQMIANFGNTATIDGKNNSILLIGLCAIDIACSKASKSGLGVVHVKNSIGFPYLYHMANMVNQRGYLCLILSGLEGTHSFDSKGTIISLPVTDYPYFIHSKMERSPKLLNLLKEQLLFDGLEHRWEWKAFMNLNKLLTAKIKVDLISQILNYSCQAQEQHNSETEDFIVMCLKLNSMGDMQWLVETISDLISDEQYKHTQIWNPTDLHQIWNSTVKEGIEVDEAVWQELLEYRKAVFVPNSERSHLHGAG